MIIRVSNACTKNVHDYADLCAGAPSFWYHMRDKSRKETSSSKTSANGPDKISVALPRELAFIRPQNLIEKSGFSSSVFNTKLQQSKRRSWSPRISSCARTGR
ncbi:hypothetical protein TNCV_4229331 [Trichonephila clavipes]|nr:hypothetical protein TNCV_4229331 [Trichonephila clavipes]